MAGPNLRVTERCLKDDLGLAVELAKRDASEFRELHPAVKKFVDMRAAAPENGEPIYGPFKRGLVCSLHVGSARAVTTWDEKENVCWLLAYDAYHRNGEPDDAYEIFIELFNKGELLPTDEDYVHLFTTPEEDFFDRLLQGGEDLLKRARANPGQEEMVTWHNGHQVMCVDILIEGDSLAEDGWMGLTLPEEEGLSIEQVYDLAAALIPPDATPIYSEKFRDRERRRGEIVYRWEHYEFPDSNAP